MAFVTASLSNSGGRPANEDHFGSLEAAGAGCWVVADGLGGHGGGATASRLAVEAVQASFRANPVVNADTLKSHLVAAHAAIVRQQGEPGLVQMRSTIVVLLANDERAVCGHVGDSRLYQLRNGVVEFQTIDHSVPGALAAGGSIAYDEIRFHEDRNRVLRSLGNEGEVNPVIVERPLRPGDSFLLCTDGFWEYVTELEMEADSAKTAAPADWMRCMASRLLRRAKPGNDNWTAIAVSFRSAVPATERHESAAPLPIPPLPPPARKAAPPSLTEKLSWIAIVCLTATLLVFLMVAIYPDSVAVFWKKSAPGTTAPVANPARPAKRPDARPPV